ncbi:MAG TPA: glycosyltransferase family 39 protein [Bryobacteraceae bacterium]|nr:glycosyltransferase family 39 protein [Bryobacteraceae bacterium]
MPVTEAPKNKERSLAQRMAASPGRWLVLFSVIYFFAEICANARRPFWFDELFTIYLADLPSPRQIWPLIARGIELNPPLPFWIAWVMRHAFGEGEIVSRIPAITGFWVMCLCLYHFVRRRTDPLYGFVALLFPVFTYTEWNSNEARGYGLLLGFCGLAILCWQLANDGVRRPFPAIGLALSIAGAISCHYYALYVAGAFALGEAIRTLHLRRVNAAIWIALAAGISPLVAYLPLIRTGARALKTFWTPPMAEFIYSSYADILGPAAVVFFLLLAVLLWNPDLTHTRWQPSPLAGNEVVTILALLAMPLVVYLATYFAPVGFYMRYVQPVVLGAAVILAMFAYRIGGTNGRFRDLLATVLVCFCLIPWTLWQSSKVFLMSPPRIVNNLNIGVEPNLPVVIDSDNDFLASYHYGPPEVRARIFLLADFPAAVRYLGADTSLRSMVVGQSFRDLHVVDYHKFVAEHGEFLLARTRGASWITQKLIADGAQIQLLEMKKELGSFAQESLLFKVTMGLRQRAASGTDGASFEKPR